jgi:uncharacterized protein (UPF0261 family)
MNVYLLATLDTKGAEVAFVRDTLAALGVNTCVVDAGCIDLPTIEAEITREEVFAAAGTSHAEMLALRDRGRAVTAAAEGAARLIADLHRQGKVSGVLAIGGSAGSTIGCAAMRALPLGVPKLMVSTLASGQVRHYVGDKDILMLNAVVDLAGLNRISRSVLTNAARAMAGMVSFVSRKSIAARGADRPLVAASMFGVTTPCVQRARELLEHAGYEVLVFHATGNGGQTLESLVDEGLIAGVLDITTTELADELVGGFLTAGPQRLTAAARAGIPQVVSVGAVDMVNFYAPESVPEKFQGRKFYQHNANVTLMRTTPEENAQIGADLAGKLADSTGPTVILLPLRGVSAIDGEGEPFEDPAARTALFQAIKDHCGSIAVVELDYHINDPEFAEEAARRLLAMMEGSARSASAFR